VTDKFNAILYGESGVGKTGFCGTLEACEKTAPCLFLDVDMGTMSLDSVNPRPTVLPIDKWTQVQVVYDKLSKRDWRGLAAFISGELGAEVPPLEYRSVVIDSGTELEYNLRQAVIGEGGGGEEIPSQPDYLKTQERFRRMYRKFRELPLSLVMTAGLRELKEESTGIIKRFPDFQPALCHDLIRMTDFIIYMSVTMEGTGKDASWKRYLLTSLSQRFIARSRSDKLPRILEGDKFYWKDICGKILD
jgi:hypothetical protein